MNLIVGELLVVVLGHPFDTIAAFQRGWFMGDTVCTAVGFVLTMLGTSDCWHFFQNWEYMKDNLINFYWQVYSFYSGKVIDLYSGGCWNYSIEISKKYFMFKILLTIHWLISLSIVDHIYLIATADSSKNISFFSRDELDHVSVEYLIVQVDHCHKSGDRYIHLCISAFFIWNLCFSRLAWCPPRKVIIPPSTAWSSSPGSGASSWRCLLCWAGAASDQRWMAWAVLPPGPGWETNTE